jgi:hypothetical protein
MGIGVGCVIRTEDQKVPITATGSRCNMSGSAAREVR